MLTVRQAKPQYSGTPTHKNTYMLGFDHKATDMSTGRQPNLQSVFCTVRPAGISSILPLTVGEPGRRTPQTQDVVIGTFIAPGAKRPFAAGNRFENIGIVPHLGRVEA